MMSDEEEGLHRLEGSSEIKGGLIIKKKTDTSKPRVAKPSLLGLDKLAAAKREERSRLISFGRDDEEETSSSVTQPKVRQYRLPNEETPSYTGGLSQEAKDRMLQRLQK